MKTLFTLLLLSICFYSFGQAKPKPIAKQDTLIEIQLTALTVSAFDAIENQVAAGQRQWTDKVVTVLEAKDSTYRLRIMEQPIRKGNKLIIRLKK